MGFEVTNGKKKEAQKSYLTEVFLAGERSGQKADPSSTSKAMRRAKHEDGSRIFSKSEFLTPLQISGFFSRLAKKKVYTADKSDDENVEMYDEQETRTEQDIQEIANNVMEGLELQHPIIFDKYNICEIVCQSKLSKFSVGMLREICIALGLDVSSITSKRKQPYMDILQELVDKCGCQPVENA